MAPSDSEVVAVTSASVPMQGIFGKNCCVRLNLLAAVMNEGLIDLSESITRRAAVEQLKIANKNVCFLTG